MHFDKQKQENGKIKIICAVLYFNCIDAACHCMCAFYILLSIRHPAKNTHFHRNINIAVVARCFIYRMSTNVLYIYTIFPYITNTHISVVITNSELF